MGRDKATIPIGTTTLAARTAAVAGQVAAPVLEVGPGHCGAQTVHESSPGSGPLSAIADGVIALRRDGFGGPALVLATDLPLLDAATLSALARWPGNNSVVPLLDDRPQPLCARWSAADLDASIGLVSSGERSMRALLTQTGVEFTASLDPRILRDVDTPEDLSALMPRDLLRLRTTVTADEWIANYAAELGLDPPSPDQIEQLLELAGVAAHTSERRAAPISTWIAARSGLDPADALARAEELAARLSR
jgi:molybdopterin-guanine dinucleotide biosynthesis protein A